MASVGKKWPRVYFLLWDSWKKKTGKPFHALAGNDLVQHFLTENGIAVLSTSSLYYVKDSIYIANDFSNFCST